MHFFGSHCTNELKDTKDNMPFHPDKINDMQHHYEIAKYVVVAWKYGKAWGDLDEEVEYV